MLSRSFRETVRTRSYGGVVADVICNAGHNTSGNRASVSVWASPLRAIGFFLNPGRFLDEDQALPRHQPSAQVVLGVQSEHSPLRMIGEQSTIPTRLSAQRRRDCHPLHLSIVNFGPGDGEFGLENVV